MSLNGVCDADNAIEEITAIIFFMFIIRPVLKLLKKKQRSDRIVAGDEKWIIKKS